MEDLERTLKTIGDEKSNLLHLKQVELQQQRATHETRMCELQAQASQANADVELLKEHISKNQEALLMLSRAKLKDVASLKTQQ